MKRLFIGLCVCSFVMFNSVTAYAGDYTVLNSSGSSGADTYRGELDRLNATGDADNTLTFAPSATGVISLAGNPSAFNRNVSLINNNSSTVTLSRTGNVFEFVKFIELSSNVSAFSIDKNINISADLTGANSVEGVRISNSNLILDNGLYSDMKLKSNGDWVMGLACSGGGSNNIVVNGGVNGDLQLEGHQSVIGIFSLGNGLTINGGINGNIDTKGSSSIYGILNDNVLTINGGINCDITASGTGSSIAGIFSAGNLLVINDDITGNIYAESTDIAVSAILASGNITISDISGDLTSIAQANSKGIYGRGMVNIGNISGDISVTAGGSDAYGICSENSTINGGSANTSLDMSGNVTVTANGNAWGVLGYGAMNLNITGDITATDASGGSNAWAIKSGNYLGATQAVADTVTIGGDAVIKGKINLSGGDDILKIKDNAKVYDAVDLAAGDDTLILAGNAKVYDVVDFGLGTDTLILQGNVSISDIDVLNLENISKTGGGTFSVDGSMNLGSGTLSLDDGALDVNGVLTVGNLELTAGTMLCGSGNIVADVVSSGVIAPGNSIGTLTINGDLINNGTLEIEANQNTSDKIIVNGTATNNGGTVRFIFEEGKLFQGATYQFLEATTLVGDFVSYISNNPTLGISGSRGVATTTRIPYNERASEFNLSASATSVGANLSNIALDNNGDLEDVLIKMDYMPAADLANFLEQVNAEKYDAYTESTYSFMDIFTEDKQARLKYIRSTGDVGSYFTMVRKKENFEKKADRTEFTPTLYGINIGTDAKLGDKVTAGIGVSYLQSDIDYSASFIDEAEQETFIVGAYGTYNLNDNWYLDSSVQTGTSKNRHLRRVIQSGTYYNSSTPYDINEEFSSEYRSKFAGALLETGYIFTLPKDVKVIPLMSLDASYINTEEFTESSTSQLALNVKGSGEHQVRFALGSVISKEFKLENKTILLPELTLKWLHNFSDGNRDINASFNDIANSEFVSTSGSYKQDSFLVDFGMLIRSKEAVAFKINYAGRFVSDRSSSELSFDVNFKF